MSSLKVHAPLLLLEIGALYLFTQVGAWAFQRFVTWNSTRTQSQWRPFGSAANLLGLGIALLLGIHSAIGAVSHQRQMQALLEALRGGNASPKQAPQEQAPALTPEQQKQQQEAANQAKSAFLTKMAGYLEKPDATNIEKARQELSKDYPGLLDAQGEKVRAEYRNAILSVYQCQKAFQDDIIATFKSKRVEKSAFRAKCEATSGAFFLRPLLIPEEQAKNQESVLQTIARGEKVGEPALTVETAKAGAALESARVEMVKKVLR